MSRIIARTTGELIGAQPVESSEDVILTLYPHGFHLVKVVENKTSKIWALPKVWGQPSVPAVWNGEFKTFLVGCGNSIYSWQVKASTVQQALTFDIPSPLFGLMAHSKLKDTIAVCENGFGYFLKGDLSNMKTSSSQHFAIPMDSANVKLFWVDIASVSENTTGNNNAKDGADACNILAVTVDSSSTPPKYTFHQITLRKNGLVWAVENKYTKILTKDNANLQCCCFHRRHSKISIIYDDGEWLVHTLNEDGLHLNLSSSLRLTRNSNSENPRQYRCTSGEPSMLFAVTSDPVSKKNVIISADIVFGSIHSTTDVTFDSEYEEFSSLLLSSPVKKMIVAAEHLVMCSNQYAASLPVSIPKISLSVVLGSQKPKITDVPVVPKIPCPINAAAFFSNLGVKPSVSSSSSASSSAAAAASSSSSQQHHSLLAAASNPAIVQHQPTLIHQSFLKAVDPLAEQDIQLIADLKSITGAKQEKDKLISKRLSLYLEKRRKPQTLTASNMDIRRVVPAVSPIVISTVLHLCLHDKKNILPGPLGLLLNASLISARACSALIPAFIQEQSLDLIDKSIKNIVDIGETDIVMLLKFFLTDVSPHVLDNYAVVLNSAPGVKSTAGQKGFKGNTKTEQHNRDSVRRMFLDAVMMIPYNEPFLARQLKQLTISQAIRALKYCRSLLYQLGMAPYMRSGKSHKSPSMQVILDWSNCLVDAHLQSLILTAEGVETLTSLQACIKREYDLCHSLENLQGLLYHLIHKKKMPVAPVGDYRIEQMEL